HPLMDQRGGLGQQVPLVVGQLLPTGSGDQIGLVQVGHHAGGEVTAVEQSQVGGVDRLGLLDVEPGGIGVDVGDVEGCDEFVPGEDVAVGSDRPAQQRQVVQQSLG